MRCPPACPSPPGPPLCLQPITVQLVITWANHGAGNAAHTWGNQSRVRPGNRKFVTNEFKHIPYELQHFGAGGGGFQWEIPILRYILGAH